MTHICVYVYIYIYTFINTHIYGRKFHRLTENKVNNDKYGAMSQAVSSRLLSAPYLVNIYGVMEVYFHVFLTATYMEMVVNVTP